VVFDPFCCPSIRLGRLSDGHAAGKAAIPTRLVALSPPAWSGLQPGEVQLYPHEREQLHPSGFSLRYKQIAKAHRRAQAIG
jgi:hypothetical protein